MRLFTSHKLTFTRKESGTGYLDETTRQWVEGTENAPFDVLGSLQPFRGRNREYKESGLTQSDIKLFYTKTFLRSVNEYTMEEADETTINGITYIVVNTEDWNNPMTPRTSHYRVMLAQKDKLGG